MAGDTLAVAVPRDVVDEDTLVEVDTHAAEVAEVVVEIAVYLLTHFVDA